MNHLIRNQESCNRAIKQSTNQGCHDGRSARREGFRASPSPGEVSSSKANQRAGWRDSPRSGHHRIDASVVAVYPILLCRHRRYTCRRDHKHICPADLSGRVCLGDFSQPPTVENSAVDGRKLDRWMDRVSVLDCMAVRSQFKSWSHHRRLLHHPILRRPRNRGRVSRTPESEANYISGLTPVL
jgi:hypothetical protein